MWNSTGGGLDGGYGGGRAGGGGGGFMNSSQFGSPAVASQAKKPIRVTQSIVPVTLQQIAESGEDGLIMSGVNVPMITVVGLIRSVDVSSTKISYMIDDTTAIVEAVQWLESDTKGGDNRNKSPMMEMTYCKISGSIRTHQGKRNMMVFKITPITDPNWITTHILEVMHSALKIQQIEGSMDGGMSIGVKDPSDATSMSNSFVGTGNFDGSGLGKGGGGFAGMQGLTVNQRMVYQVIHQTLDEAGANRNHIYTTLRGKLKDSVIDNVLDFLSSEGHIYSTIDDDHFKTTEG